MIGTVILDILSLILFYLGATAFLQRTIDLIGTVIIMLMGVPNIILALLIITLLIKKWTPTNKFEFGFIIIVIIISISLSIGLVKSFADYGFPKDRVNSDTLKTTIDEKYEYHIDLVNLFQRNSWARLYVKDIDTDEEMFIRIPIQTRNISGISIGEINHWVLLTPTDNEAHYILQTTNEFPLRGKQFEIDMQAGIATSLE